MNQYPQLIKQKQEDIDALYEDLDQLYIKVTADYEWCKTAQATLNNNLERAVSTFGRKFPQMDTSLSIQIQHLSNLISALKSLYKMREHWERLKNRKEPWDV